MQSFAISVMAFISILPASSAFGYLLSIFPSIQSQYDFALSAPILALAPFTQLVVNASTSALLQWLVVLLFLQLITKDVKTSTIKIFFMIIWFLFMVSGFAI